MGLRSRAAILDSLESFELGKLEVARALLATPIYIGSVALDRVADGCHWFSRAAMGPAYDKVQDLLYCPDEEDPGLACYDCKRYGHGYMVEDEVWDSALTDEEHAREDGGYHLVLCIRCVEERIGRKLGADDFTNMPINRPVLHALGLDTKPRPDNLLT